MFCVPLYFFCIYQINVASACGLYRKNVSRTTQKVLKSLTFKQISLLYILFSICLSFFFFFVVFWTSEISFIYFARRLAFCFPNFLAHSSFSIFRFFGFSHFHLPCYFRTHLTRGTDRKLRRTVARRPLCIVPWSDYILVIVLVYKDRCYIPLYCPSRRWRAIDATKDALKTPTASIFVQHIESQRKRWRWRRRLRCRYRRIGGYICR